MRHPAASRRAGRALSRLPAETGRSRRNRHGWAVAAVPAAAGRRTRANFPQLEILELIGKGGMGAVYKARQKELDRIVALKILPPGIGQDAAFAGRFAREAKALAKLNHPGIVTLYEFGTELPLLNGQPSTLIRFIIS